MTASDHHQLHLGPLAERQAKLDEIFAAVNAQPIQSADDLACDGLFETDEELDEFLAFTYAARRAELA
jgi:hypothetical protein